MFVRDFHAAAGKVRSLRATQANAASNVGPSFSEEDANTYRPTGCEYIDNNVQGGKRKPFEEIRRDCEMPPHTGEHNVEMTWIWLALQVSQCVMATLVSVTQQAHAGVPII